MLETIYSANRKDKIKSVPNKAMIQFSTLHTHQSLTTGELLPKSNIYPSTSILWSLIVHHHHTHVGVALAV